MNQFQGFLYFVNVSHINEERVCKNEGNVTTNAEEFLSVWFWILLRVSEIFRYQNGLKKKMNFLQMYPVLYFLVKEKVSLEFNINTHTNPNMLL